MDPNALPPGLTPIEEALPPGLTPINQVAQKPQVLTPLQKFYRTAKPYLSPALEAAGAVGGGLLGGAGGTLVAPIAGTAGGAAVGSGLGYGMAKGLERIGDVYLGGYTDPRTPLLNQTVEAVGDVAAGTGMEMGGQVAGKVIGKVAGKIADTGQGMRIKARDILRQAASGRGTRNADEIYNALKALGIEEGQTAAQATSGVIAPEWQALMQRAGVRAPGFLENVAATQEARSLKNLGGLVGEETQTGVRDVLKGMKSNLNEQTTPLREAAISRANLGQLVSDLEADAARLGVDAAAQVAKVRKLVDLGKIAEAHAQLDLIRQGMPTAASKYTYKGELGKMADKWANDAASASLDLGQGARFAQAGADSLRAAGIKPLETNSLIKSIQSIGENPSLAANPEIEKALPALVNDIAKWTNNSGVIDARALYAIRQNSVNGVIRDMHPGLDATAQKNLASKVLREINPLIDDAIEASGGTGWRDYLKTHAAGMREISEKKLTGEALNLWKTNKDEFVRLVQGESPEAVEKILGPGNYDIAKELSEETISTLQNEAKKHLRNLAVSSQATAGQQALTEILTDNINRFRLPSLINKYASMGNKALEILEQKIGRHTMDLITKASQSPEAAHDLLSFVPRSERSRIVKLLSNPELVTGEIVAAQQ